MNNISKKTSWIDYKSKIKEKKLSETLKETLYLFQKDKKIREISKIRKLKMETIEKHIINLITKSFIWPADVIGEEKFKKIFKKLDDENIKSLKTLKEEIFENNYTYFQIKCVLAYIASFP